MTRGCRGLRDAARQSAISQGVRATIAEWRPRRQVDGVRYPPKIPSWRGPSVCDAPAQLTVELAAQAAARRAALLHRAIEGGPDRAGGQMTHGQK
jgi:hypothetical protein